MSNIEDINNTSSARIPVIALPYSEKDKAELKELLIDYDNGKLYVVSATDKSIIFDITSIILNNITEIQASDMKVNIEEIGVVNLEEILNMFQDRINDNELTIKPDEKEGFVSRNAVYDNKSIVNKDNIIQVYGFDNAPENTVPVKRNGKIRWRNVGEGAGTGGSIDTSISNIPAIASNITLCAGNFQRTSNLEAVNYNVIFPSDIDNCFATRWLVITDENTPTLLFPYNTIFEWGSTPTLYSHSYNVFEIQTWDKGQHWFVASKSFQIENKSFTDIILNVDDISDMSMLQDEINGFLIINPETLGSDDPEVYDSKNYNTYLSIPADLNPSLSSRDLNIEDIDGGVKYGIRFEVPVAGTISILAKSSSSGLLFVGRTKAEACNVYEENKAAYRNKYSVTEDLSLITFELAEGGAYYIFSDVETKIYSLKLRKIREADDIVTLETLKYYTYTKRQINNLLAFEDEYITDEERIEMESAVVEKHGTVNKKMDVATFAELLDGVRSIKATSANLQYNGYVGQLSSQGIVDEGIIGDVVQERQEVPIGFPITEGLTHYFDFTKKMITGSIQNGVIGSEPLKIYGIDNEEGNCSSFYGNNSSYACVKIKEVKTIYIIYKTDVYISDWGRPIAGTCIGNNNGLWCALKSINGCVAYNGYNTDYTSGTSSMQYNVIALAYDGSYVDFYINGIFNSRRTGTLGSFWGLGCACMGTEDTYSIPEYLNSKASFKNLAMFNTMHTADQVIDMTKYLRNRFIQDAITLDGYVNRGLLLHLDGKISQMIGDQNLYDVSLNTSHPIIGTATLYADGGCYFNKKTYVNTGIIPTGTALTIEVVCKHNELTTAECEILSTAQNGGFCIELNNGYNKFAVRSSGNYKYLSSADKYETDKMYYLVGILDGTKQVFYENGVKYENTLPADITHSGYPFIIGTSSNNYSPTNFFYDGTIYSVRLYNRALSEEEIMQNYEREKERYGVI